MNFNPRVVEITTARQACLELKKVDCHASGINIMADKAVFRTIKLEQVPAKAASLLKQTFLAKGGEVAVARGTADLSVEYTDVLICATLKQYKLAVSQLKLQPWGLPRLACCIEELLAFAETFPARHYQWSNQQLTIKPGRTLIMGILNITPDSFSDGGKYNRVELAMKRTEELIAAGADIIDIGAESTRPYAGAEVISAREELDRLLPVVEQVIACSSVPISIDTYKSSVAYEALKLGAHMINDVWGLQKDPAMAEVIAKFDVPAIVMHNQQGTHYARDIMAHICEYLQRSVALGVAAGIDRSKMIIDPGIGFGKTPAQNLDVMSRLEQLAAVGCPVLLGTSRKRFIGEVLGAEVDDRVEGTGATVALGIVKGVNIVRVHDVRAMTRVARMMDAMLGSGENG
ncbi:dihydropteroate synthase|uniref:Dihydropteroate synthase n=1 Tax=Dendrosporobacter quercicolus TaxID=146817 RepID=A0A1G9MMG1_9FIRM|nr:dihydropteroate synthase [Dendrosporobacter quercicolus]NSL47078.1 dihydropteroate synthase [Dendrosporobacter quercicolus DSM 1736]SDL75211.1 dihydropteroate synthase [Dendrosporobacter quercicolus]